jgi:hypothetical protein
MMLAICSARLLKKSHEQSVDGQVRRIGGDLFLQDLVAEELSESFDCSIDEVHVCAVKYRGHSKVIVEDHEQVLL